jgi:hypothetical protein
MVYNYLLVIQMHKGQGSTILLLGFFAILFGDIFPRSSPAWFLDPVGIFVTLLLIYFKYWLRLIGHQIRKNCTLYHCMLFLDIQKKQIKTRTQF